MAKGINKNWVLYIGFTIFLVCLFGLKDILILASDKWPHLYSVVNTPRISWEETYTYFPFANHFGLDNLLPAAPMVKHGLNKFTFFPAITLISQGVIFKWICSSNIDLYFLFMHTFFPILSFWLIFLIFRRYIEAPWALMLAFFGINCYPNFSFFPYLFNLLAHPMQFVNTTSLSPLEITRTPMPSFSFFFFIFTFYISTKKNKPSGKHYLLMSILWALNLYVYLFNFIAGITFWFLYIIYTCYIKDGHINTKTIILTLVKNMVVVLVIISPIIVKKLFPPTSLDAEIFQRVEVVGREAGLVAGKWGWEIAYLLPIILVIAIIRIYCADYYELFHRFTPVFIAIFVEILASNMHFILGKFFQPSLFSQRIGCFFFRYLYFIPIIYFMSKPHKKLFHHHLTNRISGLIHIFFKRYIIKQRVIIATTGIVLATLFSTFSSIQYARHHKSVIAPRMSEVKMDFDKLISSVNDPKGIVVSESIPVNLLIPVLSKKETLLVNTYSNYTAHQETLNRLVLFAHIFNWDKQRFLDFMMPSDQYKRFYTDNNFILSDNILNKGFGYWLLNNCKPMKTKELKEYRKQILSTFEGYDLTTNIKKYKIKAIQTKNSINPSLPIEFVHQDKNNRLYLIKEF